VKRVPEKEPERKIFEIEELAKLFTVAWDDLRAYAACMLAASCGLRLGEVLGRQVRNVHLDKGYLDVLTRWTRTEGLKPPKWGSERVGVPLPARVIDAIRAVLATHRWGARPEHFVFYSVDTAFRKATKAAGLPAGRTFHCLRHTLISHASRALSPAALRYHVGHSNAATTERYEHVTAEDRVALEEAQARILPFAAPSKRKRREQERGSR
jgi:integrase